jgi:hypothetical protein
MLPSQLSRELQHNWKTTTVETNMLYKIPVIGGTFVLADNPNILYHSQKSEQVYRVTNEKHLEQIKAKIETEAKGWRSLGIIPPWKDSLNR